MNTDKQQRGGKPVLIVIDVQNDVMEDAHDAQGVLNRIARMVTHAHASGMPVVYVQHEDEWMEPGSRGWEIRTEVAPSGGDPAVHKHYPDAFADTDFEETLDRLGIGELVLSGAQSDGCVRATLHRALAEGYDVTLVADAHTTSDREYQGVLIPAEMSVTQLNASAPWVLYPAVTSRVVNHDEILAR